MKIIYKTALLSFLLISFFSISALAQQSTEKMTLEDYQLRLEEWMQRESAAKTAIAEEEAKIDELKNEYQALEREIARLMQEIYSIIGVYEADKEDFEKEVNRLDNQIMALKALTPEMLTNRQNEIESIMVKLQELKNNPLTELEEHEIKIQSIENNVNRLKTVVPQPKHGSYTVIRGDYLWRIAGKAEVYDDPVKWPRIYSANAESIKDPNLIYPEQILIIPLYIEKNQHLVVKGEDLTQIASYSEVYGDPFAWTKIYQANKNQIEDPNVIYPEQILTLPGK